MHIEKADQEGAAQKCSVKGCERHAQYKVAGLCQMHYFRVRRYGTTDLTARPRQLLSRKTPNGYVQIFSKGHPMAMSDGFAYQHRVVVYDAGLFDGKCVICGKEVSWKTMHIDHINEVRDDNRLENLRITCRSCNNKRGGHRRIMLEIGGIRLWIQDWAKRPDVGVSLHTIRNRLKRGMSHHDAVFGEKKTHKAKKVVDSPV